LFIDSVTSQTILTLDWQTLMTFVREDPRQCCNLICERIGISIPLLEELADSMDVEFHSQLTIDPVLFSTQWNVQQQGNSTSSTTTTTTTSTTTTTTTTSIGSSIPRSVTPSASAPQASSPSPSVTGPVCPTLLELLAGAFFSDRPHLLPALVVAIVSSNLSPSLDALSMDDSARHSSEIRIVASRILKTLPLMACVNDIKTSGASTSSLRKEHIVAISRLFEMKQKYQNALMMLLRNDLWDEAISLLSRSFDTLSETINAQLFEAVLHEALRKKKTEIFPKIWPFLPKTMKPLDLAHIISSHPSGKATLPLDSNAALTVGMFKEAFVKLLSA